MRRKVVGLSTFVCVLLGGLAFAQAGEKPRARATFGFLFETGYGEKVDTFHGLVTKDLGAHPDTTIALVLTPGELDSVYRKVEEVRLFEVPDLRAPDDCLMRPNTWVWLVIRADTTERSFQWEEQWGCSDSLRATRSWKSLMGVIDLIREIVEAKPEYR